MSLEVSSAVGVGDAVELSVGAHGADGEGTAAEASIAVGVLCAVVASVSLGEGANGDSSIGGSIGGSVLG